MKIYVFGNPDVEVDNKAIAAAKKLKDFNGAEFVFVNPNEDLPSKKILTLIDTVVGLAETTLLTEKDLEKMVKTPRGTAHDYDLGFQLKYLIKLGKLKKVRIVGLPAEGKIDYERIQSILRKLVAQDMQGS
jgi:hypothetical protein